MSRSYHARFSWPGLGTVLVLHVAVLAMLYQHRMVPPPRSLEPLFVHFIAPPVPPKVEDLPPPSPPKRVQQDTPKPAPRLKPKQLAVEAPTPVPEVPAVPLPPPPERVAEPKPEAPLALARPAPAKQKETGPVTLGAELALTCPARTAPVYPTQSRRNREQGRVLLRVELDEGGRVASARVEQSSGAPRLDEAALNAVRGWRCNPARRDGQAVRAVALQPFNFVLE